MKQKKKPEKEAEKSLQGMGGEVVKFLSEGIEIASSMVRVDKLCDLSLELFHKLNKKNSKGKGSYLG